MLKRFKNDKFTYQLPAIYTANYIKIIKALFGAAVLSDISEYIKPKKKLCYVRRKTRAKNELVECFKDAEYLRLAEPPKNVAIAPREF